MGGRSGPEGQGSSGGASGDEGEEADEAGGGGNNEGGPVVGGVVDEAEGEGSAGHADGAHELVEAVDATVFGHAEGFGQEEGLEYQEVTDADTEKDRAGDDGGGGEGVGCRLCRPVPRPG